MVRLNVVLAWDRYLGVVRGRDVAHGRRLRVVRAWRLALACPERKRTGCYPGVTQGVPA